MKIILADPPALSDDYDKAYPNAGLLHLVSYLRENTRLQDEDIIFLDQFNSISDHLEIVEKEKPQIYGISFSFLTQRVAYAAINAIKGRFPEILIIAGGPHPTSMPDEVLKKSMADLVAIGEGETLLADVVEKVFDNDYDFSNTPGLAVRTHRGVIRTAVRDLIPNIDTLPYPAWDRINPDHFTGQHYCKSRKQAFLVTSRGCPYRCTFCSLPVWRVTKPNVRLRSPENIASEVRHLYNKGIREIKMVSDEINCNLSWAKEVCSAIADLGYSDLYFQSNLRAWPIDKELVQQFERMNMWLIHLGCESANDRVLDGIKKKITVAQVEECLELLKASRIRVLMFMMAFNLWEEKGELSWETPREVLQSLKWSWKQYLRGRIHYMTWSIATPMPGSPMYDVAEKHGLQTTEQVLDHWNSNKDYLGIDLSRMGISEWTRLGILRLGILSKACFMLGSGDFDWKRNFFRIGILLRSFLGIHQKQKSDAKIPIQNIPAHGGVEG